MKKNILKIISCSYLFLFLITLSVINTYASDSRTVKESIDGDTNDIKINYLESGYHRIKVSKKKLSDILWQYYAEGEKPVGFIDFLNDSEILLVSGKGKIYKINTNDLSVLELNTNLDEIIKSFDYHVVETVGRCFGCRMSVKDIYIDNEYYNDEKKKLYVSYIKREIKEPDKNCLTLAISTAHFDIGTKNSLIFKEVFDTIECIRLWNSNFHHAGGRIIKLKKNEILFTVGDFNDIKLAQNQGSPYGKTLKININDYTYKIYSSGHRNQQGLFKYGDNESIIYSTEHGPRGGDELNIIKEGSNYGWPESSYGINDSKTISSFVNIDSHGEHNEPLFYWIPSIGISELLIYEGEEFFRWKNDIIVSSLRDQSLHILRYKHKNIILNDERIDVGCRIRDIKTDNAGKIYLLCENPSIIKLEVDLHDYKEINH